MQICDFAIMIGISSDATQLLVLYLKQSVRVGPKIFHLHLVRQPPPKSFSEYASIDKSMMKRTLLTAKL